MAKQIKCICLHMKSEDEGLSISSQTISAEVSDSSDAELVKNKIYQVTLTPTQSDQLKAIFASSATSIRASEGIV